MPSVPPPAGREDSGNVIAPRQFHVDGHRFDAPALEPGLYVVATPIGNLGDVSLRALATLAAADLVLAEDTRVTRRLFDRYSLARPMQPYHEHNAAEMRPKVMARLQAGGVVALVSDAGTPLVSDPGFKLVREAVEEGHRVVPVPGASAVLAALVAAGLPTDRFFFEGFLPAKSAGRRQRAQALRAVPGTLVFFETGPRLAASLADLLTELGPRPAAVARELTKTFEEVRRGTLSELAAHYAGAADPKGEIVLLVGPPLEEAAPEVADVDALLAGALARLSVKDAAAEVALATGLPRREVYQRALALQKGS